MSGVALDVDAQRMHLVRRDRFETDAQRVTHGAAAAVGAQHVAECPACLLVAVAQAHGDLVAVVVQVGERMAQQHLHVLEAAEPVQQRLVEPGLVDGAAGGVIVQRDLALLPRQQEAQRRILLVGGGAQHLAANLVGQAHGLQQAEELVVQEGGARPPVDAGPGVHQHRWNAVDAQQIGGDQTGGTGPNDKHGQMGSE